MIARSALGDLPSSPPGALTSRHGSRRSPKNSLRLARSSRCLTWRTRSRKELAHHVAATPKTRSIGPCGASICACDRTESTTKWLCGKRETRARFFVRDRSIARSALADLTFTAQRALTSRHGSRRPPQALASPSEIIALPHVAHQVAEEPRAPGHADPIAPCSDHARVSQGDPRSSAVDRSLPDGGASREQHAEKAGGITRLTFRATPGASPEPRRTSSIWMTASDHARRRSRVAGPPLREQTQQGSVLEGAPPARDAENFLTLQEG